MRVLFWGTPDFAVPTLRALLGEGHDVVGVVTQPDRPAGRGRALRPSAVKQVAVDEGLPVLQPERARGDEFLAAMRDLDPEMSVVVAYGQILRREVLDVPAEGSINVHASLLPALRGAAPINWAIRLGHQRTGVTIMRMVEAMDAGPILHQVEEPIAPTETASDLWTRLSELGAAALIEALALYEGGATDERPQDEAMATYAPKLTRDLVRVDWTDNAIGVDRHIRAMDAIPGAWTHHGRDELKVFRPLPEPDLLHDAEPGTVLHVSGSDTAEGMRVACGAGAILIREVKPAGRRRMTTADWVRGRGIEAGDRLR
ncbi:MAG TPA: methionyl-tRNA formyltransferase [Longimicrobiales bacterium]|nr:methionyl-tRNA formyltransferase [Longimicrobiales bacterium]